MDPLICVSGSWDRISIRSPVNLDPLHAPIPTVNPNRRIVQIPSPDLSPLVAVGETRFPYRVTVYDVLEGCEKLVLQGHHKTPFGLDCIPSKALDSSPLLVSGSSGSGKEIIVFNLETGHILLTMTDVPACTLRVRHVLEWGESTVYVGGDQGELDHYDVSRGIRVGSFIGHLETWFVFGVSAFPKKNVVWSTGNDKTLKMWGRNHYSKCESTVSLPDYAKSLYCSEDDNQIVVGLCRGQIQVFDSRMTHAKIAEQSYHRRSGDVHDLDRGHLVNRDILVAGIGQSSALVNLRTSEVVCTKPEPSQVYGIRLLREKDWIGIDHRRQDQEEKFAFILLIRESDREGGLVCVVFPGETGICLGRWWLEVGDGTMINDVKN